MIYYIIFALLLLFIYRLLFYTLTLKEKQIMIFHKFKISTSNHEILKFVGRDLNENNKIEYTISEDIFISKQRCHELWNLVKENNTYHIKYYGLNIPFFDGGYKIIDIK